MLLVEDISDHLLALVLLKQCKITDKIPLKFQSHKLNDNKIAEINHNLFNVEWDGNLNSDDCDTNFNRFCEIVNAEMDKIAPLKQSEFQLKDDMLNLG